MSKEQRNRYLLNVDIVSNFQEKKGGRFKVYGKAKDLVYEVANHDDVLIVEDKTGQRFPVRRDKLRSF